MFRELFQPNGLLQTNSIEQLFLVFVTDLVWHAMQHHLK